MTVPVREAAEAIVPLISVSGDAALRQLSVEAGDAVAGAATRMLGPLRSLLKGERPGVAEVEEALKTGLSEGVLDEGDIRIVAAVKLVQGDNAPRGDGFQIGYVGRDVNSHSTVNNYGRDRAEKDRADD